MIERRDASSRADAAVLAAYRSAAAARALAGFRAEAEAVDRRSRASDVAVEDAGDDTPMIEVRPSALGADVEHIGIRLCVFTDRVELRDRGDRTREVIRGTDITDIVLHKRLGGTVLTIECVQGPAIVTRGLRHDEAEAARTLIMKRTRRVGPVTRAGRRPSGGGAGHDDVTDLPEVTDLTDRAGLTAPSGGPAHGWRPAIDEAGLLRRLADLHRAGVLSDAEFEDKIEVVARLVRGEPAADTGGPPAVGAPAP
jgi:hypothetical protein